MKSLHTILQQLNENGGCTVYNTPLEILADKVPLNINTREYGYCVGDNRCSQIVNLDTDESKATVQLAIAIAELWDKRILCKTVGFWRDSASNRVYVDAVDVVETAAEAMNLGASRGELAVWDISMAREIRL